MHNPVNNKRIKIKLQDNPVHVQDPCCSLHRMILEHEQDCPAMFQDILHLRKGPGHPKSRVLSQSLFMEQPCMLHYSAH